MLLVDELMKGATVHKVVEQIAYCLDSLTPLQFNTVITPLNTVAARRERRRIVWFPLLPATIFDAMKLFRYDVELANQKPLSAKAQLSLAAVEQCIADCNGHFGSLETLWRLWSWIKEEDPSYSRLIRCLAGEMESKYSSLKLPHVRAALLGLPQGYNDKVPGLPHTYGEYIEMGVFHNTIEHIHYFVPRVSPLQLILFATNHIDYPDREVCYNPAISYCTHIF